MRIYGEKNVLHEGLTTYSIINPIEFENEETVLNDLSEWLRGPTFEKQPVLALREDLFQKRIQLYDTYDWLLLELVAVHSREPGDVCLESTVRKDFDRIIRENLLTQQGDLFIKAYNKLRGDGVIVTTETELAQYRYAAIRIERQWWDLVFEELKNRARVR
jgi:hypothetical protein